MKDDPRNGELHAPLTNRQIAEGLDEIADLLEAQEANPFRVRAYRKAAGQVRKLPREVSAIVEEAGVEALTELPGIGESLAHSIAQLARTGHVPLLDRLHGDVRPGSEFEAVAGIGPALAARIHETLGIETLEELALAAYDGRLARVPGMGQRRRRGVIEWIAGRLCAEAATRETASGRAAIRPGTAGQASSATHETQREQWAADRPPVAEILDVDREYREKARSRRLPRVAPRRFNPTGESWLPILHTERGGRHYTALYSNTARAHELGTVRDWVIVHLDDGRRGGQWTVVTARYGPLAGKRVVRGREDECTEHYRRHETRNLLAPVR